MKGDNDEKDEGFKSLQFSVKVPSAALNDPTSTLSTTKALVECFASVTGYVPNEGSVFQWAGLTA